MRRSAGPSGRRDFAVTAVLLVLFSLVACGDEDPSAGSKAAHVEVARPNVQEAASGYPLFAELGKDQQLSEQFQEYMSWVASLGVPDAVLVVKLMESGDPSIDSLATIFHEKVEFKGWLDLGHRLEDVMTVAYYQKHYPGVYPIAHRAGILEEFALIRHYARQAGFQEIPVLAYALVSPLAERHGATPQRLARRLKFNPEVTSEEVGAEDLEVAAQVYEAGGYRYKQRAEILQGAMAYAKEGGRRR